MSLATLLLVGTKKGIFLGRSDAARQAWRFSGPHVSGTWTFFDVAFDPVTRTIYGGGASNWYGPAVWWSRDLGQTWSHSSEGLRFDDERGHQPAEEPPVEQIWCVAPAHGTLYAGVEPAGLFRSNDGGATWRHIAGLRAHPSRPAWRPSNGGLCLHSIQVAPADPRQLWVAIGAGGILHSSNGGRTWGSSAAPHPCVHALCLGQAISGQRSAVSPQSSALSSQPGDRGAGGVLIPQPSIVFNAERGTRNAERLDPQPSVLNRLYQQSHQGVYRSDDGGRTWIDLSAGLPSRFGFPLAVHPHQPETIYVVPLEGSDAGRRHVPEGAMAVWRSRDGGAHWERLAAGLPQAQAYMSVLRRGLATDRLQPAGLYLGTSTGQLYASADEGESWRLIAGHLPPIYALTCVVVDDDRAPATSPP